MVAHYTFDGNSDDLIGGHNGSNVGGVSYNVGVLGDAVMFDHTGYISVPNAPEFRIVSSDDKTFAFWASLQSCWKEGIIGKRSHSVPNSLAGFAIFKDEFTPMANIGVEIDGSGGGEAGKWSPSTPSKDFAFYTFVKDGADWQFYENGQLRSLLPKQAYLTSPGWSTSADAEVDAPLLIGATDLYPDGTLAYGDRAEPMQGLMGDLRIYDRALTAGEVSVLFQSYPLPPTPVSAPNNGPSTVVCDPIPTSVPDGGSLLIELQSGCFLMILWATRKRVLES